MNYEISVVVTNNKTGKAASILIAPEVTQDVLIDELIRMGVTDPTINQIIAMNEPTYVRVK